VRFFFRERDFFFRERDFFSWQRRQDGLSEARPVGTTDLKKTMDTTETTKFVIMVMLHIYKKRKDTGVHVNQAVVPIPPLPAGQQLGGGNLGTLYQILQEGEHDDRTVVIPMKLDETLHYRVIERTPTQLKVQVRVVNDPRNVPPPIRDATSWFIVHSD
jgi:hypothetical protein